MNVPLNKGLLIQQVIVKKLLNKWVYFPSFSCRMKKRGVGTKSPQGPAETSRKGSLLRAYCKTTNVFEGGYLRMQIRDRLQGGEVYCVCFVGYQGYQTKAPGKGDCFCAAIWPKLGIDMVEIELHHGFWDVQLNHRFAVGTTFGGQFPNLCFSYRESFNRLFVLWRPVNIQLCRVALVSRVFSMSFCSVRESLTLRSGNYFPLQLYWQTHLLSCI